MIHPQKDLQRPQGGSTLPLNSDNSSILPAHGLATGTVGPRSYASSLILSRGIGYESMETN